MKATKFDALVATMRLHGWEFYDKGGKSRFASRTWANLSRRADVSGTELWGVDCIWVSPKGYVLRYSLRVNTAVIVSIDPAQHLTEEQMERIVSEALQ